MCVCVYVCRGFLGFRVPRFQAAGHQDVSGCLGFVGLRVSWCFP